ncbi:MAG TPA: hypothetical protein VFQ40_04835 [Actinomycetota bacterium]|nr:hypothetical protein [Actinomycetota bacterium]
MGRSAPIKEPEFDPALVDIRHILNLGFVIQEATKDGRTKSGWYASNLGYCLRRQFFERAGVPGVRDPLPKRQLWLGRTVEASMIARMRHAGILLADNVHLVDDEHECSGYVDFIWGGMPWDYLEYEEGEISESWAKYLQTYREQLRSTYKDQVPFPVTAVELKTAKQYSAEKMVSEGPQFTHKMQAAFYEYVARNHPDQLPDDIDAIDRFQIVVIAKEDAKMLVFDVLETHVQQVEERLEALAEAWPDKIPPCTCGTNISWERNYCPYRHGDACCPESYISEASAEYWEIGKEDSDGEG